MTRLLLLLLLLLLCSSSSAGAEDCCAWTRVSSDREVQLSFLRSDAPRTRLLHGVWSAQRALRSCTWTDDPAVIRAYLSAYRERARESAYHLDEQVSALLEEAVERCVALRGGWRRPARSVGQGSEVTVRQRVKRGFIIPGTLWCGSGNKAPSYSDLGVFSHTDSCCREHDQCKHTIQSFQMQFGVFNSNIFTMSHCDCDDKFRACLKGAGDSISDAVGYSFFNLLKVHCFRLSHRLQCSQRNWFGLCKETKMALYAEVHPNAPYESDNATDANTTDATPTDATPTDATPSDATPTSRLGTKLLTTTASSGGGQGPRVQKVQVQSGTKQDTDLKELQSSCGAFRDLDQCRDVILPQQSRFGLHNAEPRTLYHCNCTRRLFQTARLTEVQALLLGHVAPSCFLPQDCTAASHCPAVLVKAKLPAGVVVVEGRRRHLQAAGVKRKERAGRLHKLCVRMSRHTLTNTTTRGRTLG